MLRFDRLNTLASRIILLWFKGNPQPHRRPSAALRRFRQSISSCLPLPSCLLHIHFLKSAGRRMLPRRAKSRVGRYALIRVGSHGTLHAAQSTYVVRACKSGRAGGGAVQEGARARHVLLRPLFTSATAFGGSRYSQSWLSAPRLLWRR